ncbi:MAG: D-aminoacylase [Rhodospirillaceae bacterium]|jgi:N-acyl-D-amino-acid deacylase|nr:D-aminoacylase [Rhodospirillaceae bacterium]
MTSNSIIIRNGTVIDGTGADPYVADVAVADGRIIEIGSDITTGGAETMDAAGKVVAPGFIDIKTHSDWTLPLMPQAESKIRQGVTTEVIGHCGYSCAPALPGKVEALAEYLSPSAPWLTFRETSFADYLANYPALSVNAIHLIGHNTLRLMAMGMEDRPPTPDELSHMTALLKEGLAAGALGMSSGLFTAPGSFSETEELVALGRTLESENARYFTHLRDEGNTVYDSVQETMEFAEQVGVHVQIVHMKLSGLDNWGGAKKIMQILSDARDRGVRIDCDVYPYTAASNPLRNLMPAWLQEGGIESTLGRLANADDRARLREEVDAEGLNNFGRIPSWDAVRISISPDLPQYAGRTIASIAEEKGTDGFDAALDYIRDDRGQTRVLVESISEDDVQDFVRSTEVMVGSDGNSVSPEGTTGQGRPHPRFYGTFAKVLGHYSRDLGLLPLQGAVYKMTGASAKALGLRDRGVLREGFRADITVFDPETIAQRATYDDPHQFAAGIDTVLVNGVATLQGGDHTGALAGKTLRRQTDFV